MWPLWRAFTDHRPYTLAVNDHRRGSIATHTLRLVAPGRCAVTAIFLVKVPEILKQ